MSALLIEQAVLRKLRFATPKCPMSVEDIFDLPLTDPSYGLSLDNLAKIANRALKQIEEESFVEAPTKTNSDAQLRLDILKYVISLKKDAINVANDRELKRQKRVKIIAAIARQKDDKLNNSGLDELEAMLLELDE